MPRVSQQKARKDYPEKGIKKGDIYYSWAFYRGAKQMSATYPRDSQLTGSMWSQVYAAREAIEDAEGVSDMIDAVDSAIEEIGDIASQYADSADSQGAMGERSQNLSEQLEGLQSELESLKSDLEALPQEEDENAEATAADLAEVAKTYIVRPAPHGPHFEVFNTKTNTVAMTFAIKDNADKNAAERNAAEVKPVADASDTEDAESIANQLSDIYDSIMNLDWDPSE